jgi:hypothetical protein
MKRFPKTASLHINELPKAPGKCLSESDYILSIPVAYRILFIWILAAFVNLSVMAPTEVNKIGRMSKRYHIIEETNV